MDRQNAVGTLDELQVRMQESLIVCDNYNTITQLKA